jgi:tetratricopeptide (TPR) repeat protein
MEASVVRGFPRRFVPVLGLGVFITTSAGLAQAQPCEPQVARAASVQGTVEMRRPPGATWLPVKLNDPFCPGDTIQVKERSRADVALLDQSVLRLNAGATFTIEAVKDQRTSVINLLQGAAHFFSRGPRSLEVQTPFTVAGVRGTEFLVNVEQDRTLLTIFEGTVAADSPAGNLVLASGQSAVADRGKAPVLQIVARPRDAIHWALYYPPVVYLRPDEFPAGPGWQGAVRASLEASTKGDLQSAFDGIRGVPETGPDARFFAYRASLLLAVGRVDEAGADIQRALNLRANDPNALALQTVIALVQNEPDRALQVAQQAVQAAPQSATPRVALSYAQQARFDLEGARRSLEEAVQREPENALAWARLAEMHASFGHLGKSLDAAQKAVALQPNLARTQTVLGFAYLTQVRTRQAREAFEKAIALDQADALPRLGLGLAKIRAGNLGEGSRDIEVAASLDPNNALVRSYLGKAYFEEKRGPLDEREYSVAKQLDPNDPTPWFYNAIAKQTTNRPVEALWDLQKAIELNDNRAVSRSRLLLDSDLAARSASQARIYTDLGFGQLALVEGWKAVNVDPTNYSAHRFLADSYSTLPRHEVARVSELLQSQLLQPTNITPIQPRLAESNLFLISAGGPGSLSFNEFNPIFNRNRITGQLSGLVGEHDTYGGEAVIAGIYDKFSFSIGYTHFETDGFRVNFDQKDDLVNVFLQYELTPKTSVQGEFRYRKTDNGDLQLNFFPEDVLANFRQSSETYTLRGGLRHAFSPSSILLGSVIYQRRDDASHDENEPSLPFVTSLDSSAKDQEGLSIELQYLFRSTYVNLTGGVGYARTDGEQKTNILFDFPEGPTPVADTLSLDADHINLYLYSYVNFPKTVTWTLGASVDLFNTDSSSSLDTDQFNPKLGVTWNPLPGTTLRAAVFRVLKRTLITDQTLEPTQVAGFNQFFDDQESTDSWRYGGAIDQRLTRSLFGGVEFSARDMDVPTLVVTEESSNIERRDWKEYLGRVYLFWTPHPWVALSAEYLYERFEQDELLNFGFTEVTTHRVPLGLRFFHPSGLGFWLRGTYVNQDGKFQPRGSDCCVSGNDDFWVVDAGISYRLPRRYGVLTIGVTNLFDEQFKYQETDLRNPTIQPARAVFGRLTLAFP